MRPLKVHFANCDFGSRTGPNTFAHRLATQISYDGYTVADADDCDLTLAFIQGAANVDWSKPVIQRLDGIWFKPENFEFNNRFIRETYKRATYVVYQSDFDRKMIEKWWGGKESCVIRNGIELHDVEPDEKMKRLRKEFDTIFVCSANWHPQKRLAANIEYFRHLRANGFPSSCLIVLGNHPDAVVSDPAIFYAGSQPHQTCLQLYALADYMIHLAWLDHCPNVVVEALSVGTPVICTDSGGTRELVGENGIVIPDAPYNYELMDYDRPPPLDFSSLPPLPGKRPEVDRNSVDIVHAAKLYEDLFERLVP